MSSANLGKMVETMGLLWVRVEISEALMGMLVSGFNGWRREIRRVVPSARSW